MRRSRRSSECARRPFDREGRLVRGVIDCASLSVLLMHGSESFLFVDPVSRWRTASRLPSMRNAVPKTLCTLSQSVNLANEKQLRSRKTPRTRRTTRHARFQRGTSQRRSLESLSHAEIKQTSTLRPPATLSARTTVIRDPLPPSPTSCSLLRKSPS